MLWTLEQPGARGTGGGEAAASPNPRCKACPATQSLGVGQTCSQLLFHVNLDQVDHPHSGH